MRNSGKFRFKRFEVSHSKSSIKVGVDGVLLGSWGTVANESIKSPSIILDIGCGCGVIALMAAQRNRNAIITGLDIDEASIEESTQNFSASPWADRLKPIRCDIEKFCDLPQNSSSIDFILSNPPFFSSGVKPNTIREVARHQGNLSPSSLIKYAYILLKPGGQASFIALPEEFEKLKQICSDYKMVIKRVCLVKNDPKKQPHRIMLSISKTDNWEQSLNLPDMETICLRDENSEYSAKYCRLTCDFYLNF